MYSYVYDAETGGILLTDTLSNFSKEPRPVYPRELDLLGFDRFWNYEKQDDAPYLWAEAQFYFYRGKRVAKTVGGSLYDKPEVVLEKDAEGNEILPQGSVLDPIDLSTMVEKNRPLLEVLERETLKRIYDVYCRYKEKLDCFHVAFSGGKDSVVLLELVKRALPANAFIVIFGDTGMEFPDTYKVVKIVEDRCKADGIAFYQSKSHYTPEESWRLFGPPSRTLRWCCTVHKSVPQTLLLRKILGKNDYAGMDFVGVRAHESLARSEYEFENFGKKQKGQYSFNPILEWGSAEVWLYIFARKLPVNLAYHKGNSRAGCLFCPHSGGKADWFRVANYPNEVKKFTDLIRKTISDKDIESYIKNGGWIERKNGRDVVENTPKYEESVEGKETVFTLHNPTTDWKEWFKTLPVSDFKYSEKSTGDGIEVRIDSVLCKTPEFKLLKQVFHKAAFCVQCGACVVNCRNSAISFDDGLHIQNCLHCGQCHTITAGCLLYDSLKYPISGGIQMDDKSLNTFADHAPKTEWLKDFFNRKEKFFEENALGPMQVTKFGRFLSDANLARKKKMLPFSDIVEKLGWDTTDGLALMLVELVANNPQIKWYVKAFTVGDVYSREDVSQRLRALSISEKDASSIVKSYKRIVDLPFGTKLRFGEYEKAKEGDTLKRTKTVVPDEKVVLFGLYKFAEACEGYYEFTLSRLMDFGVESAGLSPAEIFGLTHEEMEQTLNGLARNFPEFVSYTSTHDLEVIRLADDKKSADVLSLF